MATQEGVCQAVFLEGGLSRDGRLRSPKLGLMDYMLRRFDPQRDRDIVFIPVGINYDRTIEDRSLLRSLDPATQRRSLWFVFKTTAGFILRNLVLMILSRWRRYGYACVNFGPPLSIKTYCRETATNFGKLKRKDRFPKIQALCQRLMGTIADVIPVLPVSLVSAVFMDAPAIAMDILQVEQRATLLIDELHKNNAPILETPHSTRMAAIADAIDQMQRRGLIARSDGGFMAVTREKPLLRYYANAIVHWLPGRKWE
jgi:glycerol-3-phosphate O-acyltransferase